LEYKSAREIWDAALGELQIQVSKTNYKTWLEKTLGLSFEDNRFTIGVPNTFVAAYLEKNQHSLIEKTLIGIIRRDVSIHFSINGAKQLPPPQAQQRDLPVLNSNFTFNSFVVGGTNQLAYSAAQEITERPGLTYNPLLICGGPGLGKTHLLQAIGHQAVANNLKVLYASGEQYTNEFVTALKERNTEEFRNKYRNADMLLIDDIDFIFGKEQTEESLLHNIKELQNASRQIAVTSSNPPQLMSQISERLRSRLEGGLIADIQFPDFDTRLHILEAKAKQKGVTMTPDTLELIAQHIRQNIRELEGSLNRVIAYARLIHDSITPELASKALENIAGNTDKSPSVTPKLLVAAVAESFELPVEDLIGQKRDKDTALARHMAMYLMKKEIHCSLAQIGRELGGRNPATVTHACQKIAGEIDSNSFLQQKLTDIQQRINNSNSRS
jgi:chromosomal replication initiator protein